MIETQAELDSFTSGRCSACGSPDNLRTSFWHQPHLICQPCFMIWYDCPTEVDVTSQKSIGKESKRRKKLGLWPYKAG